MRHRDEQERDFTETGVGHAWARRVLVFLAVVLSVAGTAASAGAAVETPPPPSIWSDQADYAPGGTVTLAGQGWVPGETVRIVVNDDAGQTWRRDVEVTADGDGTLSDQFTLPDWFVALYSVSATGPVSGTATTSFSDGNIDFQLATAGQSAPANVSWTVTWNHWQGQGNGNPNSTCAGSPDITGGTTSYNGNALASGSARPSVNQNASAKPTGAQTTGANAGVYELDYWTASATGGAANALTAAQLCTAGENGGQTVRTLYAHFKLADSTAPSTSASGTLAGGGSYTSDTWTNKNVTVSLNASDNAGGSGVKEIRYSLNGGTQTVVSGTTASIAVSAAGTTTISYFAVDNAGNTESAHSFVVKIDKTAPSVSLAPDRGPDSNGWYNHAVTFTASATDALSGSAGCDLPKIYSGPDDAAASVQLTCRDAAGNEGAGSASFRYDATPLASSASSAAFDRDGQIDVSYSVPGAGSDISGLASVSLWVSGPSDAVFGAAPNAPKTATSGAFGFVVDQGDGSYRFYVISTDQAGNVEAAPVAPSSRITTTLEDTAAPMTSDDADGQWHNSDVTVNLTASDSGSGVDKTYVKVDGGSYAEGTTATVTADSDHSNDGMHTVSYYSVDRAGNEEDAHAVSVRIDTVAPAIEDTGHSPAEPDGGNGWYRQAVVTTFEASDAGSGLDAACAADFPAEDGHNIQHVSTGSEQGSAVTVESGSCSDAAGNSQAGVASAAFDIDFTLPTITLAARLPAANAEGWNNEDVTATWDCADELSGAVAEHVSHTFTDEGADQSAEATCADEAGNEASDTLTGVSIDKTKPVVSGSRSPAANAAGWNNENVLVSFACAETGSVRSGIATDTVAGQTLTSEGAEQSVASSGDCVDKAGNAAAQASVGHISIDKSAPEITLLSRLPAANGSGWNKTDVTVTWSCVDQAGLSGAVAATSVDTRSGEGAAQTAHGSCSDRAGNSSSDALGGISIDKTAPSITLATRLPAANAEGWNNEDVTATWDCADELSGAVAEHVSHTFTDEGADQSAEATCADEAGNEASDTLTGVSIDKTKPVVSGSRSPAANAAGWNNENVLVSFACAETGSVRSGIATDTVAGQTLTSEGAEQSVASSGDCVDKAGNAAAQASVGHISIDKSAPEITLLSRLPAANGSGWNKTDVTVTWSCVDQAGLSGAVAATSVDTRSGEGAAQTAHGSCSDRAGNSSSDALGGISIDKTAPSIAIVAPADGGSYVWTTPAAASYSCSDGLSGPDGCSGSVANGTNFVSLPAGSKTFTVTASDKAGNTASMTSGYTVAYAFTGFFQPVDMGAGVFNVAKSGSSIPVKFKLGGNAGLNVFASGYPASTQVNCSSSADLDTIESTTTANNGLTYDASADQYVYVWKTNSAWSGTCRQFKAVFVDGRIVKANFKFAK